MKDNVIDFQESHFDEMELRYFDSILFNKDKLVAASNVYPTYTVMIKSVPASVFGLLPISKSSAEMWSVTGTQVDKYPILYHKISKVTVPRIIKEFGLVRLQSVCLTAHVQSKKWLERLGFSAEGVMSKYDGVNDYYMMAQVVPGAQVVPEHK